MLVDKSSDVTRSPQVERALERVRAEVFRMETSADIAEVVHVLWDELRAHGLGLSRASITIIDRCCTYSHSPTPPAWGHTSLPNFAASM